MINNESAPKAYTEFYNPLANDWSEVWPSVSKLEEECFPGKGLGEAYLKEIFENEVNIVILLKRGKEIIGFTCGIPDPNVEGSVYIDTTEITPSEQGKSHVVDIMNTFEAEARRRGYKFMTGDAEISNGYADKVLKNYSDRIIETHDHESEYSMGGMQRFFKITL